MGEYYKIVNPAKKQYIDALNFGEGVKRRGLLLGKHGLAVGWPTIKSEVGSAACVPV